MARTQVTGEEIGNGTVDKIDLSEELSTAVYGTFMAGWTEVYPASKAVVNKSDIAVASKFEKQGGYIKHAGFIKGRP